MDSMPRTLDGLAAARVARMESLTSPAAMQERIAEAVGAIEAVLLDGHALQLSFSAGKDSTCVAALALNAALAIKERGLQVPDIRVVSVDTLIENPEVVQLRELGLRQIESFARAHGLPVETHVVAPRLSEQWWPRIIGGRKLPAYVGGNGDCSLDMKVRPLTRYVKRLDRELAQRGMPCAVTLIGTRFDESAVRGAAMRERGESALRPVITKGAAGNRLMLSPIANWSAEQVFCFLQNVGGGRRYPAYAPDFAETLRVYSDSAGAGCMIDVDPSQTNRAKGCGTRHGCTQCLRVGVDKSMHALLLLPEYEYLRGLAQLRDYLSAIRWDFSRRNWISRSIEDNGDVRVFPNNFSFDECERLLRMVLTIDLKEVRRAASVRQAIDAGRIEESPQNLRMSRPQFRNIGLEQLIAIDYHWSTAGLARPFEAWRILMDVESGNEMDVPTLAPVPRPTTMPPARFVRGSATAFEKLTGAQDPVWHLSGADACGDEIVGDEALTVDAEGAALFADLELRDLLARHAHSGVDASQQAARYYLNLGIVAYPHAQRGLVDRAFRQGQYLSQLGLLDITSPDQLPDRLEVSEGRRGAPKGAGEAPQMALFEAGSPA